MDEFSKLNLKTDTTISLIRAGMVLDIDIWIAEPKNLTFHKGGLLVNAKKIEGKSLNSVEEKTLNISKFDFFLLGKITPFNMTYLSNCYLLELHQKFQTKPVFINDPSGIKNFTEKIFPLYFSKFMPDTLITSDLFHFEMMLKKHKSVVVKPLYLKGGEGIHKLTIDNPRGKYQFQKILNKFKTPLVVQEFLVNVSNGDKRVILLDGEPIGVINRIPKPGEFKANLHLGGMASKTTLTKIETRICRNLKSFLKINKLFFVGIDLIDEKLTEINVTSPTGITQMNELSDKNLSIMFWEKLLKNIVYINIR